MINHIDVMWKYSETRTDSQRRDGCPVRCPGWLSPIGLQNRRGDRR
jgi:hypothetical protein